MPLFGELFFREIIKQPVFDSNGEIIGRVKDIIVVKEDLLPKVAVVLGERRNEVYAIRWEEINLFNKRIISTYLTAGFLQKYTLSKDDLLAVRDILDKQIVDANEAKVVIANAIALKPLAGEYASLLFAISLGNASLLRAIVVPLTTAYVICEGMGWESGLNNSFKEVPQFLGIYTIIIALAGFIVLIPKAHLIFLMVLASFINGLLLPFILLYSISMANNRQIMGSYAIQKGYSYYIAWGTVIVIICLTVFLVVTIIIPMT